MMFDILKTRLKQGMRTIGFPKEPPVLPDRFRGRPVVDGARCRQSCPICEDACPNGALYRNADGVLTVDLGLCLFCMDCVTACPEQAISHSKDYRLATCKRENLVLPACSDKGPDFGTPDPEVQKLYRRSFKIRQVSAGGCNACEADMNVLSTIGYDLGRFGIQVVASPRHAEGILITGPVTDNMSLALDKTIEAVPQPRVVMALGACAISGGIFSGHNEIQADNSNNPSNRNISLFIPGCPPHPITILDGLLRFLGQV